MSANKKGFIPSKGFFAAVAVCVIGASAATWVAVDRTIHSVEENNDQIISQVASREEPSVFPQLEDAAKPQSEIVKSSSSSQPSPKQESSSSQPQKPYNNTSSSTKPAAPPALSYQLPLDGEITAAFSNGELVKNPTLNEWRTHDGVDINAPVGTNVIAAAEGKVTKVTNDPLWGMTVEITHDDKNKTVTIYCGLAPNTPTRVGDQVKAGGVIGLVGELPAESTQEPHLHFAVKQNGKYIDPMKLFGKASAED